MIVFGTGTRQIIRANMSEKNECYQMARAVPKLQSRSQEVA